MSIYRDTYIEAGHKAALARNVGDEATATHWRGYFIKCLATETESDRAVASDLYKRAYETERTV